MRITKIDSSVKLRDLQCGRCFLINNQLFSKLRGVCSERVGDKIIERNCFNISDICLTTWQDDTPVIPVEIEEVVVRY